MRESLLAIGVCALLLLLGNPISPRASAKPAIASQASSASPVALPLPADQQIAWLGDYQSAMDQAQAGRKMLLVWFFDPKWEKTDVAFEQLVLNRPAIQNSIERRYVALRLPVDAKVFSGGKDVTLLKHVAFAEMLGRPGLAILDMTEQQSPLFRRVVSVYPFARAYISRERLAALLDLPRGTLTQRTMIFAVRTHPERPSSATSHLSPVLIRETENHALHQASISLQGHHNWESRFHTINARLPAGLVAQEVCAESWPGQSLVEAADECVSSWRQSPGHWEAVRSRHTLFGYDMKRGRNGIWYATGIFARRF